MKVWCVLHFVDLTYLCGRVNYFRPPILRWTIASDSDVTVKIYATQETNPTILITLTRRTLLDNFLHYTFIAQYICTERFHKYAALLHTPGMNPSISLCAVMTRCTYLLYPYSKQPYLLCRDKSQKTKFLVQFWSNLLSRVFCLKCWGQFLSLA